MRLTVVSIGRSRKALTPSAAKPPATDAIATLRPTTTTTLGGTESLRRRNPYV
ncbi:hypothetical protein PISMIDRAFT_678740 [Pisolithus microcarpus 441]|uniref:Uncharacterized protein n=1 Tax=Pisolithus microcarpus 441 TaxID=765257 RepID=A0A0C9Z4K3_9AGAM|nr:hypothetical protein PISMIDRAFT_678740 [Pisolithus microcarpus 441]